MNQKLGVHPSVLMWALFAAVLWVVGIYALSECAGNAEAQEAGGRVVMPVLVRHELVNGRFEFGDNLGSCRWFEYVQDGRIIIHYGCPQEVRSPQFDTVGWDWNNPYICPGYRTSQPEMRYTSDPDRTGGSGSALQWFTFWHCQHVWIEFPFGATEGGWKASATFHTWFSDCGREPYKPPLAQDCETPLTWGKLEVRVCIDAISTEACSDWTESYNEWATIETPAINFENSRNVRVIVESRTHMDPGYFPTKHQNMYLKEAEIWRLE
jgi:hypothetical protein